MMRMALLATVAILVPWLDAFPRGGSGGGRPSETILFLFGIAMLLFGMFTSALVAGSFAVSPPSDQWKLFLIWVTIMVPASMYGTGVVATLLVSSGLGIAWALEKRKKRKPNEKPLPKPTDRT